MFLWNYQEIKAGWAWAKPSNLRKLFMPETYKFWQNQETPEERLARKQADPTLDPHYKLMLRNLYPESPHWWWGSVVIVSWAVGLGCLYGMNSTLPCKFNQDADGMKTILTNIRVGIPRIHTSHLVMHGLLRSPNGYYGIPVQYPANLPDACRIYV